MIYLPRFAGQNEKIPKCTVMAEIKRNRNAINLLIWLLYFDCDSFNKRILLEHNKLFYLLQIFLLARPLGER